jgi:hypothetical protein
MEMGYVHIYPELYGYMGKRAGKTESKKAELYVVELQHVSSSIASPRQIAVAWEAVRAKLKPCQRGNRAQYGEGAETKERATHLLFPRLKWDKKKTNHKSVAAQAVNLQPCCAALLGNESVVVVERRLSDWTDPSNQAV